MIDVLDKLQNTEGCIKLILKNGEKVIGYPDCIVWDEDDEGWETIKTIRFEPCNSRCAQYFRIDDIESYEMISQKSPDKRPI